MIIENENLCSAIKRDSNAVIHIRNLCILAVFEISYCVGREPTRTLKLY